MVSYSSWMSVSSRFWPWLFSLAWALSLLVTLILLPETMREAQSYKYTRINENNLSYNGFRPSAKWVDYWACWALPAGQKYPWSYKEKMICASASRETISHPQLLMLSK